MTIPIIPGPFSFLGEAGAALGEYGAVKEEHRRYVQKQAADALANLERLTQLGILRADVYGSPDVQHLAQVAGVPIPAGSIAPQPKEALNKRAVGVIQGLSDTGVAMASGLPTPAGQAREEIAGKVLTGPLTTGQESAVAQVPTVAQAGATEATAKATAAQAKAQEELVTGSQKLYGNDPQVRKLAEEAALGILPYRIEQLKAAREGLTERLRARSDNARIILGALQGATSLTKQAIDAWETKFRQDAYTAQVDANDEKAMQTFREAYEKTSPRPTPESVSSEYIKAMTGMSMEEYQKAFNEARQTLSEVEISRKANRTQGQGAAPTVAPTSGKPDKIQGAMSLLTGAGNAGTSELDNKARQFAEAVRGGGYTPLEARFIFAQLKRTMNAEAYERLKVFYNTHAAEPIK